MEAVMVELQSTKAGSRLSFNICKCDTTGYFPGDLNTISRGVSFFYADNNQLFIKRPLNISSCVYGDQNRYYRPKYSLFLTFTKLFLWTKSCNIRGL